jgi:hypothetical protein
LSKADFKRVRWPQAYRIINARYPPIDVFERVANPADWESLYALEQLTNPRRRDEGGEISLVPVSERVVGPGASWVMAAFTHVGRPSRYTAGTYGVYYASKHLETAVRETVYHFSRFLASTSEPRGTMMELRTLVSERVDNSYCDVRTGFDPLHDPDNYAPVQSFGAARRSEGVNGILYRSVRHAGGECLAVFKPKAIPIPKQGPHLRYHFDGIRIDRWFQIGTSDWTSL